MSNNKVKNFLKRKTRARVKIAKITEKSEVAFRLSVFRSNKHISAQIIELSTGNVVAAASTYQSGFLDASKTSKQIFNKETSYKVGQALGKIASEKGVKTVVFDKSGYAYHGNVKALADGARSSGLAF